jgi:hypothetical protein
LGLGECIRSIERFSKRNNEQGPRNQVWALAGSVLAAALLAVLFVGWRAHRALRLSKEEVRTEHQISVEMRPYLVPVKSFLKALARAMASDFANEAQAPWRNGARTFVRSSFTISQTQQQPAGAAASAHRPLARIARKKPFDPWQREIHHNAEQNREGPPLQREAIAAHQGNNPHQYRSDHHVA